VGGIAASFLSAYLAEATIDMCKLTTPGMYIKDLYIEMSQKDLEEIKNGNKSPTRDFPEYNIEFNVYSGFGKVDTYRVEKMAGIGNAFIDFQKKMHECVTLLSWYYVPVYFNGNALSSEMSANADTFKITNHVNIVQPSIANHLLIKDPVVTV
jgi:hypothetical protein